jgi:hypothetical protein
VVYWIDSLSLLWGLDLKLELEDKDESRFVDEARVEVGGVLEGWVRLGRLLYA